MAATAPWMTTADSFHRQEGPAGRTMFTEGIHGVIRA